MGRSSDTPSDTSSTSSSSSSNSSSDNSSSSSEDTQSNATSYQLGSNGKEVEKIQARLKELGYFNGEVDGNFGEATQAAFKTF